MNSDVMGTPVYMAPERVSGDTSPLPDMWSLGITLAEILSGKKPFSQEYPVEVPFPSLRPSPVPAQMARHVRGCLVRPHCGPRCVPRVYYTGY